MIDKGLIATMYIKELDTPLNGEKILLEARDIFNWDLAKLEDGGRTARLVLPTLHKMIIN